MRRDSKQGGQSFVNQEALFATAATTGGGGSGRSGDNVTDWCLAEFRRAYEDPSITRDGIWEYLYGVMHAPDWRERYRNDLRKSPPRIPLAADFEAFRSAGRELMDLHVGYETGPEADVLVEIDGETVSLAKDRATPPPPPPNRDERQEEPHRSDSADGIFRIEGKMRLRPDESSGGWLLEVNRRCRLLGIPAAALEYEVSGRSPLAWAVDSLRFKDDGKKSGIRDDPNRWHAWADDPFELIRHLRRLVWIGVRSAEIIRGLPPSLEGPGGPQAASDRARGPHDVPEGD